MNIQQVISERLEVLPEDIKSAIKNTDIVGKFSSISSKHGLHIDQMGALQTEITLVLIGLEPTKDFTDNIRKNLNITRGEALSIASDVNEQIFYGIRESLQSMNTKEGGFESKVNTEPLTKKDPVAPTPTAPALRTPSANPITQTTTPIQFKVPTSNPIPPSNSNLQPMVTQETHQTPTSAPIVKTNIEQAGRFTIEKPPVGVPQYKEKEIDKENLLKGIEDPAKNMVDHILSTPVKTAQNIETKTPSLEKPLPQNKPYSSDPYREEI